MERIDFNNLDKKSKIQIGVTSFLVVVFIIIMANSIKTIFQPKAPSVPVSISPDAFKEIVKRDISASSKPKKGREEEKYLDRIKAEEDTPWGRDPFSEKAAIHGSELSISDFKLEGILWHHGRKPTAIVNGLVVRKGDKIGNATIIDIEKDSIIVSDGSKNYRLNLW